ncbi:MAG TPA: PxKF domain-containing protein, partial [Nitrospirota bacterium]
KIIAGDGAGQVIVGAARDAAGNSATVTMTLNLDKTAPTIRITGIEDGAVYAPGAVPSADYEVTDDLSGVESQSARLIGGNTARGTVYTYYVDARDRAGNSASASASYTVTYSFSGFLEPVSLGGPFRLGSTIPVKFRLTDGRGISVSTAHATIMLQQISGDEPVGDPINLPAYSADAGSEFRYDAMKDLYMYNLGTGGLAQGSWEIRAYLDDGSVRSAFIHLKKK